MIEASWIYAIITILLALVDSIRIKKVWGKTGNISHEISENLALYTGAITLFYWVVLNCKIGEWHWIYLLNFLLMGLGMGAIRLVLYDPALNFLRIMTKTNPTMRLDYVSTTTSSYEDQHSEKLSFWQKRAIGVAGWVVIMLVYYKIF